MSRLTNDTMSFSNFWALFNTLFTAFCGDFVVCRDVSHRCADCLVVIGFHAFLAVTIWYYQRYSSRVYRRMRERLSELNTKLSEAITGISVIQQFRQEHRINGEFDHTNDAYFKTRQAMIRTNSLLLSPLIDLFYALGTVMVLGIFGVRGLNGYVAAGVVYAFITYLNNFYNPMTSMMDNLSDFQDGVVAGSRVLRVMDDPTIAPAQHADPTAKITRGKIEFRHVTFAYDGQHPVLKTFHSWLNQAKRWH